MKNFAAKFMLNIHLESRKSCASLFPYMSQDVGILFNKDCHRSFGFQALLDSLDYYFLGKILHCQGNQYTSMDSRLFVELETKMTDTIEEICHIDSFDGVLHFEKVFLK